MGAFSRLRYVIAANVNALIEKAEDPVKLLRALIREMEDASEEARMACADLLAEQQHLERLEGQLSDEVAQWRRRAENAAKRASSDYHCEEQSIVVFLPLCLMLSAYWLAVRSCIQYYAPRDRKGEYCHAPCPEY